MLHEKVVALSGRRSNPIKAAMRHTSDVTIDIQTQVDRLRSIRSDLEVYYWDQPRDGGTQGGRRFQISFWIRQLADRTAALESLLLHQGAPQVVLPNATLMECDALETAAAVLDQWIHEDESFRNVLRAIGAILAATDLISLKAAGGVPRHTVT